jgi:hypothetical protein
VRVIGREELLRLLNSEESDILERKASLSDVEAIRHSMVAFANDIAGRGGGKLIIGQNPDKTLAGLKVSDDEAQRTLSEIARNRCRPSIHVTVEMCEHDGKSLAVVDIKSSPARPHFRGECYVRQGSTNRIANDAEIMVLRSAAVDPKVRQLMIWQQQGQTMMTCRQYERAARSTSTVTTELAEIKETYIALRYNPTFTLTVPLEDLRLGYDEQNKRPQLMFNREF